MCVCACVYVCVCVRVYLCVCVCVRGGGDVSGRETVHASIYGNEQFAQDFPIFKQNSHALGVVTEVLVVIV